jgi:hypothetical protein
VPPRVMLPSFWRAKSKPGNQPAAHVEDALDLDEERLEGADRGELGMDELDAIRPSCEAVVERLDQRRFSTPTTSRTAAADFLNICLSASESFSLTISSTPPAPSFTGTPM